MRQKRNSQNREFLFPVLRIDNACSNRSQDTWRSHALRVAVGKCCQLRQTKSTILAAIDHVKHRRMWCHVGCAWQVLSITANRIDNTCSNRSQDAWRSHALWVAVGKCCQLRQAKSTILAAIDHVKHRRMWCHVGCAWQVLSITANRIDNTCSNRSQDAWRSHALWVAVGKCCQLRQAKSTMLAAIGRRMRGVVTPCGLQLASVVNYGKQNRQYLQQQVT